MRTDRIADMEKYVLGKGSASLEELCSNFGVSINTVRRDVLVLLQRGKIKKVYGGVSAIHQGEPLPMSVRSGRNDKGKRIIGELAATLIPDNTSVFLDSGSTTPQVLKHLSSKNITVITHSLAVLYEASRYPNLKVINLGGVYQPGTSSYVGMSTLENLLQISVQTVLIAATGVSIKNGLTNTTFLEADIKRCITERATNIILMADHTKFDHEAVISFCPFEKLSAVVTDCRPPEQYIAYMKEKGIKLLCP